MSLYSELICLKNNYADRIAFRTASGDEKSYEKFFQDVCKKASEFQSCSWKRMAVLAGTSYEWICYVYGALLNGKTVIVMDPLLPLDNLAALIKNTDAEIVWADEEDKKLRRMIEDVCHLEMNIFTMQEEEPEKTEDIIYEDGELICFTSGTSSQAKGVVIPIEALYTNSKNLAEQLVQNTDGIVYTPLPFYHLYADAKVLAFLYQGRTICLGNPRRLAQELAYFRPEVLLVVPTIAEFLLDNHFVNKEVKAIVVSGGKCEKSLEDKAAFQGIFVQNVYGSSETAGGIGLNLPGFSIDEMVPIKGVEIFWENENEIVLRTAGRMKEYYKKPEETREVLKEDKLITGDIGKRNANGTFTPLGRKNDVIAMKNGDKLYCNELDEELSNLDGVTEACVIYVDGKIIAVIVTDNANRTLAEETVKMYNKKQPYFRKLEEIWLREEALPRTRIGKMKRKETEEQYLRYKERQHE